jgi:nitrate/nitrite-specific signal transduction histidine kinase
VVPIRKLTDVAERISKGELDIQVNIGSKDEIAVQGNAILKLRASMRLSIERFNRRKKSERKA